MAIVVEDGTGLSTADSYLSVADADTYWAAHGAPATWTAMSTAEKELALRESTRFLDLRYRSRLRAEPYLDTQALEWPRIRMFAWGAVILEQATIPSELEDSTAELALRYQKGDRTDGRNPLNPDEASRSLKRHTVETKDKHEAWEWSGAGGTTTDPSQSATTDYSIVDSLLSKFLHSGPLIGRS